MVSVTGFKEVKEHKKSAEHIARHGVTLDEVRETILRRPYWTTPGRDGTTLIYGRTYAGRYLFVVVVASYNDVDVAFVVTARDMTSSEKTTFMRKAR